MFGGAIGPAIFFSLEGELTGSMTLWEDRSMPGHSGVLAFRMATSKGRQEQLVGLVDLQSASQVEAQINLFRNMQQSGQLWTIRMRVGNAINAYPNYFLWDYQVQERHFSPAVSGGLIGGLFLLRTQFTVQYGGII